MRDAPSGERRQQEAGAETEVVHGSSTSGGASPARHRDFGQVVDTSPTTV
jgi:hypothetical protein